MTTALVFPTSALLLGAVLTAASIARAESPAESAKIVAALDTEYQAAVPRKTTRPPWTASWPTTSSS